MRLFGQRASNIKREIPVRLIGPPEQPQKFQLSSLQGFHCARLDEPEAVLTSKKPAQHLAARKRDSTYKEVQHFAIKSGKILEFDHDLQSPQ